MSARHRGSSSSSGAGIRPALAGLVLLATVVAVLGASPHRAAAASPAGAAGASDQAPISQEVERQLEQSGTADVIVHLDDPATGIPAIPVTPSEKSRARRSANEVMAELEPGTYSGDAPSQPSSILALSVDERGLEQLRDAPGVARITHNGRHRVLDARTAPVMGAPGAWAAGDTGAGSTVAILDTGVDTSHPYLQGRVVGEACFSGYGVHIPGISGLCPGPDPTTATGTGAAAPCSGMDGCDHGTHVAGIAAGAGGPSSAPSGIAPAASILAVKVFSMDTWSSDCGGAAHTPCIIALDSDIVAGLQFVLEQDAASLVPPVAAANLSLGSELISGACDTSSPETTPIEALEARGIATVIASGNGGSPTSVASPACVSSAITVGSVDAKTLSVSSFSNSSPMLDLLAPGAYSTPGGVGVVSSLPGGGYGQKEGTSMAAPHVAGAIAVLRSARGSLPVDRELTLLGISGTPVLDPRNGRVTPMVRIDRAVGPLPPLGSLDSAGVAPGSITVQGWAFDPDTTAPGALRITLDGSTVAQVVTSTSRADVNAAFPGYGPTKGFSATFAAPSGTTSRVCVTALDDAGLVDTSLGCRTVTVPGGNPFGVLDSATPGPGSLSIAGWAIDPDTAASIAVHVYVDGTFRTALVAGNARPDLAVAFPGYGPNHGYATTITGLGAGRHNLCVFALNVATGNANPPVGCATVTI